MKQLIMTGTTGNFGVALAEELQSFDGKIIYFIRAKTHRDALQRVHALFSQVQKNVEILSVDLTHPMMGLGKNEYTRLSHETTHILHAAASTRFSLSLPEARDYNVQTTKNMLLFAKDCLKLEHFGYMSTAFVAGKRTGRILESELIHSAGFLNTYEQSKYEAEFLVSEQKKILPISIYRPSFLITDIKIKGVTSALTYVIGIAKKSLLLLLPGSPMSTIDILPAHFAAETIIKLFLMPQTIGKTYHIVAGEKVVTVNDIITAFETHYKKKLMIQFISDEETYRKELLRLTRFRPDMRMLYTKLNTFVPELCYPKLFDITNTRKYLSDYSVPDLVLDTLLF